MAFDAFLQIDGIPGESSDDKHQGWIELKAFQHGACQPTSGSQSSGGGRSGQRVNIDDFTAVKDLDKATPKLYEACCKGTHIKKIVLELCRASGQKQLYQKYTLEDSIVSSVNTHGDCSGDEMLPGETVSFNIGKITWSYTETDHKTGASKGTVETNWNLTANKPD